MRIVATIRTITVAAAGLAAFAMAIPAQAATMAPIHVAPDVTRPAMTDVHWEYRHHHRYWVPDRRRDDHRR